MACSFEFRLAALLYSGCQKNVPFFERFFLQPLIPAFRISELIFEKRYKFPVVCLQAQILALKIDLKLVGYMHLPQKNCR